MFFVTYVFIILGFRLSEPFLAEVCDYSRTEGWLAGAAHLLDSRLARVYGVEIDPLLLRLQKARDIVESDALLSALFHLGYPALDFKQFRLIGDLLRRGDTANIDIKVASLLKAQLSSVQAPMANGVDDDFDNLAGSDESSQDSGAEKATEQRGGRGRGGAVGRGRGSSATGNFSQMPGSSKFEQSTVCNAQGCTEVRDRNTRWCPLHSRAFNCMKAQASTAEAKASLDKGMARDGLAVDAMADWEKLSPAGNRWGRTLDNGLLTMC